MKNKDRNNIAIILVRPQLGENIGAVARAMKNFDFKELRIVAPRDGWPNAQADAVSCKAIDIIKDAKIFNTSLEATSDIQLLYATTARPRNLTKDIITPQEAEIEIANNPNNKLGIMFGPENSGLSNADLSLANSLICIETGKEFQSLNLAQSASIICHTIFSKRTRQISNLPNPEINTCDQATKQDMESFYQHLETLLEDRDFFKVPERKRVTIQNIRAIFSRNRLITKEVRMLRGIIHCLASGKAHDATHDDIQKDR